MSVSGTRTFFDRYAGIAFEALRVPSPSGSAPNAVADAVARMVETIERHAAEIAAVVVEPLVQGAGGMLTWSAADLAEIRRACDDAGVFLVADEVFTGFGRTGTMFACEQASITPDFLCLSKGLTGGNLPFAVTMTTSRVFDGFRGAWDRTFWYGHSYCGSALGCAAANAVLDAFELDDVLAKAQPKMARMQAAFADLGRYGAVEDVRGVGMVAAVQLGRRANYGDDVGWRVARAALSRGLFIRPLGNVVYLCPALTISDSELDRALAILDDSLRDTVAG
jgi:adenosylmethionine-8-amino-7-oxononanoate aminotransferase